MGNASPCLTMLKLLFEKSRSARVRRHVQKLGASAARRPGYALVFVKPIGPRPLGLWRVRDGPAGGFVLFATRREALAYAYDLLAGRRGQVIEE